MAKFVQKNNIIYCVTTHEITFANFPLEYHQNGHMKRISRRRPPYSRPSNLISFHLLRRCRFVFRALAK